MNRATFVFLAGMAVVLEAGADTGTRMSKFTYDAASGLLTSEIIEPDDPNLCLVTQYAYDGFGNRISATTRNCNGTAPEGPAPAVGSPALFASRTTTTFYEAGQGTVPGVGVFNYPQGLFPTRTRNAVNDEETRTFDPRFGLALSLTGPNLLTTSWTYDQFGRKTGETRADSSSATWSYGFCSGNPSGCAYSVVAASAGTPVTTTYYDTLNRVIRTQTEGFAAGSLIWKDTQYNDQGLVYRTSRPYYSTAAPAWTTFTYDVLGRVKTQTEPNGAVTTTSYLGMNIEVTNALNQKETRERNGLGQLTKVTRGQ
jgi:hypothetical protein